MEPTTPDYRSINTIIRRTPALPGYDDVKHFTSIITAIITFFFLFVPMLTKVTSNLSNAHVTPSFQWYLFT